MFRVDVSPDMKMYDLLIRQGYDPTYALCEFLDNSIHAFQEHSDLEVLEIDVDFYSSNYHVKSAQNTIVISDRGPGIDKETLKKALQPANRPVKPGLSEFGIGMKSAAVWFSKQWTLTTYPKDQGKRLKAEFDLEGLLSEGRSDLAVSERTADKTKHGTVIKLRGLRSEINNDKYRLIRRGIGDIYHRFLNRNTRRVTINTSFDGVSDSVNAIYEGFETLVAPTFEKHRGKIYKTGEDKKWRVDVDTMFQGRPVNGFIHLMKSGGYKKNPGLVLIRHGRVIVGTTDNHFKPEGLYSTSNKAASMRLQGELNLDGHPVTYTKDSFSFDDEDFGQHLRDNVVGLRSLLTQAENFRAKGAPPLESQAPDEKDRDARPGEQSTNSANAPGAENANEGSTEGIDQSDGEDQAESPNEGAPGDKLGDRKDNRIHQSSQLVSAINRTQSKKLLSLYDSLCKVSLVQHPTLMYVGAWTFFEVLSKMCGNNSSDFSSFFSGQAQGWGIDKNDKRTYVTHLKSIAENGNIMKHERKAMQISAGQLAVDFDVLEPLIVAALNNIK